MLVRIQLNRPISKDSKLIRINGIDIVDGKNLTIVNGKIQIDGEDVTPDDKIITIEIHGDVETVRVDSCTTVDISGTVGTVSVSNGDITCGDIAGTASTTT